MSGGVRFFEGKSLRGNEAAAGNEKTAHELFCQDDIMAIDVREAVLGANLHISQEVALIGMKDIEMASLTGVDLTTIRQNIYQMGIAGAEVLINRIQRTTSKIVNQVIIDSDLVIRKSCGFSVTGYVR
jgi:DNA-binding LacI/PurR family transcriptional regulator